jgi:hypothetical protein
MAIKGLTPQLAERGKIKIGELGEKRQKRDGSGEYMLPKKLDHFVITTMQRDAAGRLMPDTLLINKLKEAQGGIQKLVELPVRLLYDDIDLNFLTRYSCYVGNRCWCTGDGEQAERLTADGKKYEPFACPCERSDPLYPRQDKCKTLGTLQVLLEGVDRVGGVWKFRTTSWNTVNAILSSLALIKTLTGGPLAGIPLYLVLSPKTVTVPTSGQNMVVYVVSLEYRGPEQQLAELGYEIARKRIEHRIRMDQIEDQARRLLVAPHQEPEQDQRETAAEFFPEGLEAGFEQPPGPYIPPGLQAPPAGDGSVKKPAGGPELKESPPAPAVTFPELMEMVHKGRQIPIPQPIRSHNGKGKNLGTVTRFWQDSITEKPSLTLTLEPENLQEINLAPEMIVKSFKDAGINVFLECEAERLEPPKPEPPQVTGPCDFHPDLPATWQDEQGFKRCADCPGPTPEEVPPGFDGPAASPPTPPPAAGAPRKPRAGRKSLF